MMTKDQRLKVVASALAAVGPEDHQHAGWIHTAVLEVYMVFSGDRNAAVRVCEALARDPDEHVRGDQLLRAAALAEISPILHSDSSPS